MRNPERRGGWFVALPCLLAGCSTMDVELLRAGDGGLGDGGSCSERGDPILLEASGSAQCSGVLAAAASRFALCSCSDLILTQSLTTDAFDSTGATSGSGVTAAVGVVGNLNSAATLSLGGALYVAGSSGAQVGSYLRTSESLRLGGPLAVTSSELDVGTDAYVAGDLSGTVKVLQTLHVPASAIVGPSVTAASLVRETVNVPPPCDCSAAALVNLTKAVATIASTNDNGRIGLGSADLSGATARSELELPCGQFYVTGIDLSSDLSLVVHGRAALVVGSDVTLRGSLNVSFDEGGELDLIVGGRFSASGGHDIGNTNAPARMRIWLASAGTMLLDGDPGVGAIVYAPQAQVSAPLGMELFGSLFAGSLSLGSSGTIHYDRAVLSDGASCGATAQPAVH